MVEMQRIVGNNPSPALTSNAPPPCLRPVGLTLRRRTSFGLLEGATEPTKDGAAAAIRRQQKQLLCGLLTNRRNA